MLLSERHLYHRQKGVYNNKMKRAHDIQSELPPFLFPLIQHHLHRSVNRTYTSTHPAIPLQFLLLLITCYLPSPPFCFPIITCRAGAHSCTLLKCSITAGCFSCHSRSRTHCIPLATYTATMISARVMESPTRKSLDDDDGIEDEAGEEASIEQEEVIEGSLLR